MLFVKDIISFLEDKFPPQLAYDWDNIGFQIGDINREVNMIMVTLEATTPVIEEAIQKGIDLIITHHPFIFSPLKSVDFATPQGKNIQKIIKNDIAVYAMHTNYDVATGGMNDILAEKIGLQDIKPFSMIDDVHGLGRIGSLKQAMSMDELAVMLKSGELSNEIDIIRTVETVEDSWVKKVAVIGGSGGKHIHEAKEVGADVLITGDVTYHTALDAKDIGLGLLDIGHYAEVVMEKEVVKLLTGVFKVEVVRPSVSKNPIK